MLFPALPVFTLEGTRDRTMLLFVGYFSFWWIVTRKNLCLKACHTGEKKRDLFSWPYMSSPCFASFCLKFYKRLDSAVNFGLQLLFEEHSTAYLLIFSRLKTLKSDDSKCQRHGFLSVVQLRKCDTHLFIGFHPPREILLGWGDTMRLLGENQCSSNFKFVM